MDYTLEKDRLVLYRTLYPTGRNPARGRSPVDDD